MSLWRSEFVRRSEFVWRGLIVSKTLILGVYSGISKPKFRASFKGGGEGGRPPPLDKSHPPLKLQQYK